MAINQNWKLGRRASTCHHGGRAFADGESIITAILAVGDTEEYERRDYSVEAWEEVRPALEPFSFWRSRFEVKEPEKEKGGVVEKETAESLLRRLMEEDDLRTENARYVLALMLERKRIMKEVERKETENGSRLLIYEHVKSGDVLIVRDPMLKLDELGPVQEEVSALLAPKAASAPGEGDAEAGSGDGGDPGGATPSPVEDAGAEGEK